MVLFFEPFLDHRFWAMRYFPDALVLRRAPPARRGVLPGTPRARDVRVGARAARLRRRLRCRGPGRRPEAYLDPEVHARMSRGSPSCRPPSSHAARARLAADLDSGEWGRRFGHLLQLDAYDAGYRLLIAEG